ncbi:S-adenosyl-L-methionine-dependent methyltransferase [Achaetomium macrosporum]|uniref:S-adenosyl-L-methionine-dependent methyltransferase n=1 Tax=Achaetomium macrosporum TaxID=79813 RepID=A0AAN7H597_9PEZI|nr:S-adenosyl-L-methionine-dependent methyltransferase [Achaetomium macrosporum]
MASVDPKTKTTYATTDWAHYQEGRPRYPRSLNKIIYSYRQHHPNARWERLVDIGAGSGVAATSFMADFEVVQVSDPSPANLDQARVFLPDWAQRHGLATRLEYSQSTGEEAYRHVGEGQADLVICATAAHFMDPDGLVASIAKMLRPGGTLAVFSYWMPTFPGGSQRFRDAFARAVDALILKPLSSAGDSSRARLAQAIARRMAGNGTLDSLPLPEELYDDPVRVYINHDDSGGTAYRTLFLKYAPADLQPTRISRVSPRDRIVSYCTGVDTEAEGWAFDVDKKWLQGFFDTIRPPNQASDDQSSEAQTEWEHVFDSECPSGTVRVVWPAYVVLATRK